MAWGRRLTWQGCWDEAGLACCPQLGLLGDALQFAAASQESGRAASPAIALADGVLDQPDGPPASGPY